jgi:hypothetical protein
MAYPIKLNNLYKSEKEAGLTTAKSYPEWYKTYQLNQQAVEEANQEPEILLLTYDQPEVTITSLQREVHEDTSEELELAIASTPLTKEQVDAIVAALTTQPTEPEVVVPTSKAAHARQIYDEMELAAITNKLQLVRKDIINRFVVELPISKVGASTYLQNIKTKKGLVTHK